MSKLQKEPTKLVPVPSTNKIPERDVDKSPILEARHLGIDFGGLTAVNDFNMAIGRTEIAGLIGPNGAGKTTVFNLLTKVYQPTRGTILLDGHDTAGKTTVQVNRMGIARTFQNIRLFSNLSVEDNVKIGLHNHIGYGLFSGLLRLPGYWKEEKVAHQRALELLSISGDAGVFAVKSEDSRQFFITGHPEYDPDTLSREYFRDKEKGLPIHVPYHYFPDNDPSRPPIVRWRSAGQLLYTNWLNYYVYQTTPYDISEVH